MLFKREADCIQCISGFVRNHAEAFIILLRCSPASQNRIIDGLAVEAEG